MGKGKVRYVARVDYKHIKRYSVKYTLQLNRKINEKIRTNDAVAFKTKYWC
jgi:hypothetical protein